MPRPRLTISSPPSRFSRGGRAQRPGSTANACGCFDSSDVHDIVHLVVAHTYSIAEARARLRIIVDQAEAGLEVELTRRGEPVAVVLSCREVERLRGKRPRFRDVYNRFLDKYSLDQVGLEDEFSNVRDTTTGRQVLL